MSLVDTPETRPLIHCSECGIKDEDPLYRREELVIVRHWKAGTGSDLGIYCTEHASKRSVWVNSHLAPDHLLPAWLADKKARLANQVCLEDIGLGGRCGGPAADFRNDKPMCDEHLERFDRLADIATRMRHLGIH